MPFILIFVGDANRLSCEPRGIPPKGLQIACVVAIYVNDVICKLALRLRTGEENNSKVAHDSVSPTVDSLSTKLNHNRSKQ